MKLKYLCTAFVGVVVLFSPDYEAARAGFPAPARAFDAGLFDLVDVLVLNEPELGVLATPELSEGEISNNLQGLLIGGNLTTGNNNIDIGANVLGTAADANTIRIPITAVWRGPSAKRWLRRTVPAAPLPPATP